MTAKKRQISKDLAHAATHLDRALANVKKHYYDYVEGDIEFAYNIIKAAINREINRRRKEDDENTSRLP